MHSTSWTKAIIQFFGTAFLLTAVVMWVGYGGMGFFGSGQELELMKVDIGEGVIMTFVVTEDRSSGTTRYTATVGDGESAAIDTKTSGIVTIPRSIEIDVDGESKNATVDRINNSAFMGCVNIEEIVIPYNIRTVADGMFEGCSGLIGVMIEGNIDASDIGIQNLSALSFVGADNLRRIAVSSNYHEFEDGVLKTRGISPSSVIVYLPSNTNTYYDVSNRVEVIDSYAFYGADNLESVVLSETIKEIRRGAFSNMENLKSITFKGIPENIDLSFIDGSMNFEYLYFDCDFQPTLLEYFSDALKSKEVEIYVNPEKLGWGDVKGNIIFENPIYRAERANELSHVSIIEIITLATNDPMILAEQLVGADFEVDYNEVVIDDEPYYGTDTEFNVIENHYAQIFSGEALEWVLGTKFAKVNDKLYVSAVGGMTGYSVSDFELTYESGQDGEYQYTATFIESHSDEVVNCNLTLHYINGDYRISYIDYRPEILGG